jgi:hypothetical protein
MLSTTRKLFPKIDNNFVKNVQMYGSMAGGSHCTFSTRPHNVPIRHWFRNYVFILFSPTSDACLKFMQLPLKYNTSY